MAQVAAGSKLPLERRGAGRARTRRPKALVVSGDEGELAFLAEALHSFAPGCDVATARSVEQAGQWLQTFEPDMLLVDHELLVDGRVAAELLDHPRLGRSKIAVLADAPAAELRLAPGRIGARMVLAKPVGLRELLAAARELVPD